MRKKIMAVFLSVIFVLSFSVISAIASETTGTLSSGAQSGSGMAGVLKAAPTVSPAAGDYHATQTVSLTASGSTKICYTTDGTTAPSCASPTTCTAGTALASGSTVSVASNTTIKSAACYADSSTGPIATSAYTFSCTTATVSNGSVAAYPGCAITCNSGYTLNGSSCDSSGGAVISGGGGGGGGSYTPTNTVTTTGTTDSSTAMTVSNTQTGNLTQPLSNGAKVELTVPQGSVTAQTSFSATAGALTSDLTPLSTVGALMIGNNVFNVTAISNGVAVRNFSGNLTITLTVPDLPDNTSDLGVYYFNDTTNLWVLISGAIFNTTTDKVTFQVNHLTKFAVFKLSSLSSTIKTAQTVVTEETTATATSTTSTADDQIKNIVAEAATIAGRSVESVLAAVGAMQDAKAEAAAEIKYTNKLISGLKKNVTAEERMSITNFINYGTPTTKILGAGERAGVISSYKSAFGKVPTTAAEWSDAIKIANGRWPSETSATAESKAVAEFKNVYKRSPNMKQANDNAAVTVISYGLRPTARNTNSEKAAIKSFKAIYGHAPVSALAWDIVRAIAYSGAKR